MPKPSPLILLVADPDHPGCLVSQGHKGSYRYPMVMFKRGRGRTRRTTSTTTARWILEQKLGRRLRKAEEVCHACHNTKCLNQAHLSAGSHALNKQQKWAAGRGVMPHWDSRGERNGQSKLTATQVREIRRAARRVPQRAMAKKFRVTAQAISLIVTGRTWRHVAA
jgi:homing endonuclease-like protein